ncbi:MAG TPA: GlsB/YeaQ/YmgE family stress response membrane protein [Candidatus Binatia bacterium]|nr:GlsB/YeaQ/YmgE family stress response membrane protein [Candidatus Binatia bacterium]
MMSIIGWVLFGLVVGVIGKLLMPGRDPGGFIITILLGIAGALLGGFLGRALGLYREGDPVGFIMAVIGSIVLLVIYRFAVGRRHTV